VVVTCPKCKVRLKVDETKLPPQGSRFKCPKCTTILLVKKPAAATVKKTLDERKVIVAHSKPEIRDLTVSLLKDDGYEVIVAADGIDFMVKALKELPFLSVVEVALPKIYGFELCKRLKARTETKEMKFILVPAIYDKSRYRREPVSLYGADEYLEEHDLGDHLMEKVNRLRELPDDSKAAAAHPSSPASAEEPRQAPRVEPAVKEVAAVPAAGTSGEAIERAKRLARTIINDIYLYHSAKVDEAVRNNNFYTVFAAEVREGKKLYENRIPQDVRNIEDFYREAIDNFLSAREKAIT
jgi:predicted Zn finger-like uncharacterized protein